jgi:hypothetical protein
MFYAGIDILVSIVERRIYHLQWTILSLNSLEGNMFGKTWFVPVYDVIIERGTGHPSI